MRKLYKKIASVVMTTLLLSGMSVSIPTVAGMQDKVAFENNIEKGQEKLTLSNPGCDIEGNVRWDMVYFGNYWQENTNEDNEVDEEDEKQPILWRVLSVSEDGKEALLLSEKSLDDKPYHIIREEVTWEECSLRSWLNGYDGTWNKACMDYRESNFLDEAFSKEEQLYIKDSMVEQNVKDKIFLLSAQEVTDVSVGFFEKQEVPDYGRVAYATTFCMKQEDENRVDKNEAWWLRTSGNNRKKASVVMFDGSVYTDGHNIELREDVRPVLRIRLDESTNSVVKYAGKAIDGLYVRGSRGNKEQKPTNPNVDENLSTWDCIYYGKYVQKDTNQDGIVNSLDKKEPIKWRVLWTSDDGTDALLISDKSLEQMPYNKSWSEDVTWKNSSLRSWLNGYGSTENVQQEDYTQNNFLKLAFTEKEQMAILDTKIMQEDTESNMREDTSSNVQQSEDFTIDKVYLLSKKEVAVKEYGFLQSAVVNYSKIAKNTDYTSSYDGYMGKMSWWLRSTGSAGYFKQIVTKQGLIKEEFMDKGYLGVRPVIHLDLTKAVSEDGENMWSYAGTVSAKRNATKTCFVEATDELKKGDIDGDGIISLQDAQLALRAAVLLQELDEEEYWCADLFHENEVTLENARCILRAALHLDSLDEMIANKKEEQSGDNPQESVKPQESLEPQESKVPQPSQEPVYEGTDLIEPETDYGKLYCRYFEKIVDTIGSYDFYAINKESLQGATTKDILSIKVKIEQRTKKPVIFLRSYQEVLQYEYDDGGKEYGRGIYLSVAKIKLESNQGSITGWVQNGLTAIEERMDDFEKVGESWKWVRTTYSDKVT